MSGNAWPWSVLGLEDAAEADVRAVKRAYARKLKAIDPASDIPGFSALRQAYEAALARAERAERQGRPQGEAPAAAPVPPADTDVPGNPDAASPPPDLTLNLRLIVQPDDPEAPPTTQAPPEPPAAQKRPRTPADPEARALAARQRLALRQFQERADLGQVSAAITALVEDADLAGPEARDRVARALVGVLRAHLQPPFQGESGYFSDPITRADLARIDRRLGWLADHKAMRADLGGDPALTEAVVDLLVGRKVIDRSLLRQDGLIAWAWFKLREHGRFWTWVGLFIGFQVLRATSEPMPDWAIWAILLISAVVLAAVLLPQPVGRPLGRALSWAGRLLAREWSLMPRWMRRGLVWGGAFGAVLAVLAWLNG